MLSPIKEYNKGASVAWQPHNPAGSNSRKPLLALGSRSFAEPALAVAYLDTSDQTSSQFSRIITVPHASSGGYRCLDWSNLSGSNNQWGLGLLAGAVESDEVLLWDAAAIVQTAESMQKPGSQGGAGALVVLPPDTGLMANIKMNPEAKVRTMAFNGLTSQLACGGVSGEICLLDINGQAQDVLFDSASGSITGIDWNKAVNHVFAASATNATVQVWNSKSKKKAMSLQDPAHRKRTSVVRWLADSGTSLMVAFDDDQNPSIQIWDLRVPTYPFKELTGNHTRGITDLEFCAGDDRFFTSASREGRCITWSVQDRHPVPFTDNATGDAVVQIRHCPTRPGLAAAALASERVNVYNLMTNLESSAKSNFIMPKWMMRPSGASSGFGGKVVGHGMDLRPRSDSQLHSGTGGPSVSQVTVSVIHSDEEIVTEAEKFDFCMINNNFMGYIDAQRQSAIERKDEHETLTWTLMRIHLLPPQDRPAEIMFALGFHPEQMSRDVEAFLGHKGGVGLDLRTQADSNFVPETISKMTSQGMLSGGVDGDIFGMRPTAAETESFFNRLVADEDTNTTAAPSAVGLADATSPENMSQTRKSSSSATGGGGGAEEGPRLGKLSSTLLNCGNAVMAGRGDWTQSPLLFLKQAILLNDQLSAVEIATRTHRYADAFMLAGSANNPNLWNAVRAKYLEYCRDPFLPVMAATSSQNFELLAQTCELSLWSEVAGCLCIHAYRVEDQSKFKHAMAILGKRLEHERSDVISAVICFTIAGEFSAALQIWNGMSLTISNPSMRLQNLAEKATAWLMATGFSGQDELLSKILSQYAELLANSGQLVPAMRFLCLIPGGGSHLAALRNRIYCAGETEMNLAGIARPADPVTVHTLQPAVGHSQGMPQTEGRRAWMGIPPGSHQPQGMMNQPQGMMNQPQGMMNQPQGMMNQPQGMMNQPQGMMNQPQGMMNQPQGMMQHHSSQGMVTPGMMAHQQPQGMMQHHSSQGMIPDLHRGAPGRPMPQTNAGMMPPGAAFGSNHHSMKPPSNLGPTATAPQQLQQQQQQQGYNPSQVANQSVAGQRGGNRWDMQSETATALSQPAPPMNLPQGPMSMTQRGAQQSDYTRGGVPTAPAVAAAQQVAPGMPNPWPIPTPTQQLRSTTTATEHLNQKIHQATSAETISGDACPPGTANKISGTVSKLISVASQMGEPPKRVEELQTKAAELERQLSRAQVATPMQELLIDLCSACDSGDYQAALRLHASLRPFWHKQNKDWLLALKRLITLAQLSNIPLS